MAMTPPIQEPLDERQRRRTHPLFLLKEEEGAGKEEVASAPPPLPKAVQNLFVRLHSIEYRLNSKGVLGTGRLVGDDPKKCLYGFASNRLALSTQQKAEEAASIATSDHLLTSIWLGSIHRGLGSGEFSQPGPPYLDKVGSDDLQHLVPHCLRCLPHLGYW